MPKDSTPRRTAADERAKAKARKDDYDARASAEREDTALHMNAEERRARREAQRAGATDDAIVSVADAW